jgi:hypothetical protein
METVGYSQMKRMDDALGDFAHRKALLVIGIRIRGIH